MKAIGTDLAPCPTGVGLPAKELRVSIRLRSNRLLTLREGAGLSQPSLAAKCGVSRVHVAAIESFGKVGRRVMSYSSLERSITKVADYFGVSAVELAPKDLFDSIAVVAVEREISRTDAMSIAEFGGTRPPLVSRDPGDEILFIQDDKVGMALGTLYERDEEILRRRLAGDTLEEVAVAFGTARERIRAIEYRALRKLLAHRECTRTAKAQQSLPAQQIKYLCALVLSGGLSDLVRYSNGRSHSDLERFEYCLRWIRSSDRTWPFDFENLCEVFDRDPVAVRKEYLSRAADTLSNFIGHFVPHDFLLGGVGIASLRG